MDDYQLIASKIVNLTRVDVWKRSILSI
jgi:hypothetical protein